MKPTINAVYITVQDMDRAVRFYEEILDRKVTDHNNRMSEFKMGDFTLLLYNPKADDFTPTFGDNTVIVIRLEDTEKMLHVVEKRGCKVVMPITEIGSNLVFQIEDLEGNIIEFYQVKD